VSPSATGCTWLSWASASRCGGWLFGWWDGFFLLAFRTFCWMFMGVVPVRLATDALAGLDPGILDIAIGGFFVAVAGGMLLGSLERR
jgi:hypothetical protein